MHRFNREQRLLTNNSSALRCDHERDHGEGRDHDWVMNSIGTESEVFIMATLEYWSKIMIPHLT